MCGCSAGKSVNTTNFVAAKMAPATTEETLQSQDCPYTVEQLANWLTLVKCYKDKGLYVGTKITKKQVHSYIGIILSAQNYADNICYFEKELQEVENFIVVVISTGQC